MATAVPLEKLYEGLNNILTNSEYYDLVVQCGKDKYKVHKAILCSQSKYFKDFCINNSSKEDEIQVITIPSTTDVSNEKLKRNLTPMDPKSISRMIHYLYHLDYLETQMEDLEKKSRKRSWTFEFDTKEGPLVDHAIMYAVGDVFKIPGLKALALVKFERCLEYTNAGLAHSIPIIYTSTAEEDKGLRNLIVKLLHRHASSLMNKDEITQHVRDLPALSYALLMKRLAHPYKCYIKMPTFKRFLKPEALEEVL